MKRKKNILIVDDDKLICNNLKDELTSRGFNCFLVNSGQDAIVTFIKEFVDLVILELNLPDRDGIGVIEHLRSFNNVVSIIVVSKRSGIEDKVLALNAGANDYMVKPAPFLELLARINKEFRYKKDEDDHILTNGPLTIDYGGKVVYINGKEIHLTKFEYKILYILATNIGKIVSYNELISGVWGNDGQDQNGLRVFMAGIRKKIEPPNKNIRLIETIINMGYKMNIIGEEE